MEKKQSGVHLEYNRLESVTVTISEKDLRKALFEKAIEIAKQCNQDVAGWGKSLKIKERHDGVGIYSENYAEVKFTRKVKEE